MKEGIYKVRKEVKERTMKIKERKNKVVKERTRNAARIILVLFHSDNGIYNI